jgi:hypothetical protein
MSVPLLAQLGLASGHSSAKRSENALGGKWAMPLDVVLEVALAGASGSLLVQLGLVLGPSSGSASGG